MVTSKSSAGSGIGGLRVLERTIADVESTQGSLAESLSGDSILSLLISTRLAQIPIFEDMDEFDFATKTAGNAINHQVKRADFVNNARRSLAVG